MGTTWRVRCAGRVSAEATTAAIESRLADLVAQLSHWAPESALCRFNAAAAGTWHVLPPDLARVVDLALSLAQQSDGAFDPAIGALVDLWGFGPPGPRPVPDAGEIAAARAGGGWRRLAWRPRQRSLFQPGGVRLDLSGIAKGYAVDALGDLLAATGSRHYLVEIGGEFVGRGVRPDGDPWWVDLEVPPGIILPPLRVALHGIAVATSGSYVRGAHNLDPRTGRPPTNGIVAASVIAPTAALADALASIVLVAYPNDAVTRAYPVRLVTASSPAGGEVLSPPLLAMLAGP